MPQMPAAEFVGVTKDYPLGLLGLSKRRAVTDVSLAIPAGQVFGLLGPNRAGKTTLVKILLTLCRATAGTVRRLGEPVDRTADAGSRRLRSREPCLPALPDAGGAAANTTGHSRWCPYEVVKKRTPVLLEKVGLADRAHDPIRTFSKGMTQRLGVAQALINDPGPAGPRRAERRAGPGGPATRRRSDSRTAAKGRHGHARVARSARSRAIVRSGRRDRRRAAGV